jgi:glutaredoxin
MGESVELVTRTGCHLCEQAEQTLKAAGIAFTAVDVDSDSELFRLYDWRVPVLLLNGQLVCEGQIDLRRLAEANLC